MAEFLVRLNTPHHVTDFGCIDGVLYEANSFKEVESYLEEYVDVITEESCEEATFSITNLETSEVVYRDTAELYIIKHGQEAYDSCFEN